MAKGTKHRQSHGVCVCSLTRASTQCVVNSLDAKSMRAVRDCFEEIRHTLKKDLHVTLSERSNEPDVRL